MGTLNEFGQPTTECGILLVGHGTRAPKGMVACADTVQWVRDAIPHLLVETCFLEFAQPTIPEGIDALIAKGVRRVVVAPLMLLTGRHVRHDIPVAVAAATRGYPNLDIVQAGHLGCAPRMVELSRNRYLESLRGREAVGPHQTVLVLVGRGSRDEETIAELRRLAGFRRNLGDADRIEVCFTAMAEPRLEDVLSRLALDPIRRIVVQPHLLFPGYLSARISSTVAECARNYPSLDWVTTEPLGPDRLLAEAVAETVQRLAACAPRTAQTSNVAPFLTVLRRSCSG